MACVPLLTALVLDRHRCFALCLRKVVSQVSLAGRSEMHPRATHWVLQPWLGPKLERGLGDHGAPAPVRGANILPPLRREVNGTKGFAGWQSDSEASPRLHRDRLERRPPVRLGKDGQGRARSSEPDQPMTHPRRRVGED